MLTSLQDQFSALIAGLPRDRRMVIFHDSDADGLTAAVVLDHALRVAGFSSVQLLAPDRQRDAWRASNRLALSRLEPELVFLLDLGSREEPLCDAPVVVIDHHRPEGTPPGGILLTGYGMDPIPNTSLLVLELCRAVADVSAVEWVAAVGVLSDLGEKAPFDLLGRVKRTHRMADLKEVTALVNAARRSAAYDPQPALRALMAFDGPAALLASSDPDVLRLREARTEVQEAMKEAKKAAPVFAGGVALIRVHSRCQVHPLIAQIWRSRLPRYVVIVANDGYLEGRVNFSMRSAGGASLIDFLRQFDPGEGDGSFAHGHDQATGGSLETAQWRRLLQQMGFES